MNWKALLTSPPPVDAFALDDQALVFGRVARGSRAMVRLEKSVISTSWYQIGPVGVLAVEHQVLGDALATVLKRLDRRPSRAHLVVPNEWVRSIVVDAGELPRRREDAEDLVRWRLKKVLPCRPEDVRLDFIPGAANGNVLVVLTLDRPLQVVEEVFARAGVILGQIEPRALALTALLPASTGPSMLATVEERALALVLLAGGRVSLIRHKPLPADVARAEAFVIRELSRTLHHAREREGLAGPLLMRVAATVPALAEAVRAWAAEQDRVELFRLEVGDELVTPVAGVAPLQAWSLYGTLAEGQQ